jgi:hypothetical protein
MKMRATIEHRQKTTGLVSKTTRYQVALSIQFEPDELAVIKKLGWKDAVVLERQPDNKRNFTPDELRDLGPCFYLKMSTLLKGEDVYTLDTPREAKEYDELLKDTLRNLKANLEGNQTAPQGKETIEL